MVTIFTTSLTFNNSTFCPHSVFMCFVLMWEQTATCATYSINWLAFTTETNSVYCAVRTGSLTVTQVKLNVKVARAMNYFLWRLEQGIALCRLCSGCHFGTYRYSHYTMIVCSLWPHRAESEDDSTFDYHKADFYLPKRALFWIVLTYLLSILILFRHLNLHLSFFFLFSSDLRSRTFYFVRIWSFPW